MYITYERYLTGPIKGESSSKLFFTEQEKYKGEETLSSSKQKEQFRPSFLVRTDNMEVVSGSTVKGPYYALSYSTISSSNFSFMMMNQEHEIITIDQEEPVSKVLTFSGLFGNAQSRTEQYDSDDDNEIDKHFELLQKVTHKRFINKESDDILRKLQQQQINRQPPIQQRQKVDFKGLIQQICKDFNIQYIWFDQMCIDHNDPEKKAYEIKHMHQIYSNAYCTISLVPELKKQNDSSMNNVGVGELPLPYTGWGRSLWALQEAFMSQQILFVGRNTYVWSKDIKSRLYSNESQALSLIYNLYARGGSGGTMLSPSTKNAWSASTILLHARTRMCSVPQDRIFALANLFPEIMENMSINYSRSVTDLSMEFYSSLIVKDQTLLLFGTPACSMAKNLSKRQQFYSNSSKKNDYTNSCYLMQQENSHEDANDTRSLPKLYNNSDLPSWTGSNINNGIHIQSWRRGQLAPTIPLKTNVCFVRGEELYLTSCYVRVSILKQETTDGPDCTNTRFRTGAMKPISDIINSMERSILAGTSTNKNGISEPMIIASAGNKNLVFINASSLSLQSPEKSEKNKNQQIDDKDDPLAYYGLKKTHVLPVKPDSKNNRMLWVNDISLQYEKEPLSPMASGAWLSLVTTDEDDVSECVILSDLSYNIGKGTEHTVMPVIAKINTKKGDTHYKAIGVCVVEKLIEFIEYRVPGGEPYIVKKEMNFNHPSFIQNEQEFIIT